jgi:hypothetical protein
MPVAAARTIAALNIIRAVKVRRDQRGTGRLSLNSHSPRSQGYRPHRLLLDQYLSNPMADATPGRATNEMN